MSDRIIIPGRLPGLNEIIDAARNNKYDSAEQKKVTTDWVMWHAKKAKLPKMERVALNITWYEKNKMRDPDNVQGGGTKYIWDGLVAAGVLVNDGWKQQGPVTHKMAVDKNNPRVEVEIEEVG